MLPSCVSVPRSIMRGTGLERGRTPAAEGLLGPGHACGYGFMGAQPTSHSLSHGRGELWWGLWPAKPSVASLPLYRHSLWLLD